MQSQSNTLAFDSGPDFGRPRTRLIPALQARIAADEVARERAAESARRAALDRTATAPVPDDAVAAGPVRPAGATTRAWLAAKAMLATGALYFGSVIAAAFALGVAQGFGLIGRGVDLGYGAVLGGNLLVLLVLVALARREGRTLADLLAPPADWRIAGRLLLPWLAGAALLAILVALATVAMPKLMDHGPTTAGGLARLKGSAWIAAILVSVVAAPLVEELAFRGHLQRRLAMAGLATGTVVTLSTVLFTLFHVPLPLFGLVVIAVLGIACGRLRERTQSVLPGMLLHAFWNTAVVLIAVLAAVAGKV